MATTENQLRQLVRADGFLYTNDVVKAGIRKEVLRHFLDAGCLEKEARGIYSFSDELADEYTLLQSRGKKAIFSHGTALYLHGMSDRIPSTVTMTIPQGYNVSRLQEDFPHVRFHRVKPDLWAMGIVEGVSPQGGPIKYYDKERTVCDVIRFKQKMDPQVFLQGVKDYFAQPDKNTIRLMEYAHAFGIEDKVQNYMEILAS